MPDYQNGKVYAIRSHQTEDIYIGSTIQPLSVRFRKHEMCYKNHKDGKYGYVTSFKILDHEDAYIELLENYPCNNRNELMRREGELIRQMKCVNERVAGRTVKEYYNENKQKRKEYQEENKQKRKEYYIQNKQHIAEKDKEYREKNKHKIAEYREKNKQKIADRVKEYYIQNKQHIAEKQKEYREKNKQQICEQRNQKNICPCGGRYTRNNQPKHNKTKRHINYIENTQH